MADRRTRLTLIRGDREAWERRLVSLAATGSTEDLAAAVHQLKRRAPLHLVSGSQRESSAMQDGDEGTPTRPDR